MLERPAVSKGEMEVARNSVEPEESHRAGSSRRLACLTANGLRSPESASFWLVLVIPDKITVIQQQYHCCVCEVAS